MIAQPWPSSFPLALASIRVGQLMGHPLFESAKHGGDAGAATRLVRDLADPGPLIAMVRERPNLRLLTLSSEGQANQIPAAFARHMATAARVPLDIAGLKRNSPKHTGRSALFRFSNRAEFGGRLKRGAQYVMADDVLTQGGTLSEMRQWVIASGAMVEGVAVLAVTPFRERKDFDPATLALSARTRGLLERRFGSDPLTELFTDRKVYGGQWKAMTEGEAWLILGFRSLADFRCALDVEAAKSAQRAKDAEPLLVPPAGNASPAQPSGPLRRAVPVPMLPDDLKAKVSPKI